MLGLLTLLFSCKTSAPGADADWPDPATHLPALKEGMDAALLMWKGKQPAEAQALLEQTYTAHFEPFEEALQAHGVDTLPIEYDFGRIGHRMRRAPRRSEGEEVAGLLMVLHSDVEEAFAVLPATATLQAPPADP